MLPVMEEKLKAVAALLPEEALGWHVPMSGMTTLRLGGPADLVCEPGSEEETQRLLTACAALQVPVLTVGRGSNLLVRDGGWRGMVLSTRRLNRLTVDGHTVTAGAGVPLSVLARRAADAELAGLTFAGGIPGSLGGAVLMNAGAYGGEMKDVVTRVSGFTLTGAPFEVSAEECRFGHRTSALQELPVVICRAELRLADGKREALLQEMADLNARRREKQPLELPSAGSTFKRPANGYASALIDQCGLKGLRIGGAQVSEKHAGFCVNLGGTSADFLRLMEEVRQRVLAQTGIELEPEVRIVGEEETNGGTD